MSHFLTNLPSRVNTQDEDATTSTLIPSGKISIVMSPSNRKLKTYTATHSTQPPPSQVLTPDKQNILLRQLHAHPDKNEKPQKRDRHDNHDNPSLTLSSSASAAAVHPVNDDRLKKRKLLHSAKK